MLERTLVVLSAVDHIRLICLMIGGDDGIDSVPTPIQVLRHIPPTSKFFEDVITLELVIFKPSNVAPLSRLDTTNDLVDFLSLTPKLQHLLYCGHGFENVDLLMPVRPSRLIRPLLADVEVPAANFLKVLNTLALEEWTCRGSCFSAWISFQWA
jgi:hypothetical protein